MSEQPPESGAPEPPSGPPVPPPGPPPGYAPPPGPPPGYGPPGPAPQSPYNPYAQPPGPQPTQPLWQGHQAPQQGWPGAPGYAPPRNRRRTWLVVLVVVLFLALAGAAVTAAVLLAEEEDDSSVAVSDIQSGWCLESDGLADAGESVGRVEEVDCSDEHDAEVFATFELAAGEGLVDAGDRCVGELDEVGKTWSELDEAGLEIRPLVAGEDEGDKVVCFIRHRDGEPLTGSEFE